ncbi:MAG: histidinol-phosphatase [Desulfobacterales bacterium]|nr:histidinol-phosphatase [Desulfobacterales bacterium]MDD4070850.1 histidinol-phosphatase [Desulfobacterales bacterium]MDD4391253.1 histidinol-phosphatase [Desulfobacterales bacterium]
MIDYHVHTRLCNHATGAMADYVRRAIALGFREICFLDHLTLQPAGKVQSMTPDQVPLYFQAVQALKEQFSDVIDVKAGLETDYDPAYIRALEDIIQTYTFDVIGSSLHFLDGKNIVSRSSDWAHGKWEADDLVARYLETLDNMLEYNYFDIVCHLDLMKKFGRVPNRSFETQLDQILSKIQAKGLTVEVNTSGWDHPAGEAYPSGAILKKCCESGIAITLGSDAHRPEDVGRHYDRAIPMLVAAGCRFLATFTKRSRIMIPLPPVPRQ